MMDAAWKHSIGCDQDPCVCKPDALELARTMQAGQAFTDADAVQVAEAYIALVMELEAA